MTVLVQFACKFYTLIQHRLTNLALLTFYTQTWEEYHTKTLTLGIVSGPVEGILTLCIVYASTAYLGGGSFWQQSMLGSLGVASESVPAFLYNMRWTNWYMAYGGVMLVFNTISRYVSKS
jgi:ethanolaminephosphotransferase